MPSYMPYDDGMNGYGPDDGSDFSDAGAGQDQFDIEALLGDVLMSRKKRGRKSIVPGDSKFVGAGPAADAGVQQQPVARIAPPQELGPAPDFSGLGYNPDVPDTPPSTTARQITVANQQQNDAVQQQEATRRQMVAASGDPGFVPHNALEQAAYDATVKATKDPRLPEGSKYAPEDDASAARYRELEAQIKANNDAMQALPKRTGISWSRGGIGTVDAKRQALAQDNASKYQEMAMLRGGHPAAFGGGDSPESWSSGIGPRLIYNKKDGTFRLGPDPDAGSTAGGGSTSGSAPAQKGWHVAPIPGGKGWGVFNEDGTPKRTRVKVQAAGPVQPGYAPPTEEADVQIPAADPSEKPNSIDVLLAKWAHEQANPEPEKGATPANRLAAAAQHRSVDEKANEALSDLTNPASYGNDKRLVPTGDALKKAQAAIEENRRTAHAKIDEALGPVAKHAADTKAAKPANYVLGPKRKLKSGKTVQTWVDPTGKGPAWAE